MTEGELIEFLKGQVKDMALTLSSIQTQLTELRVRQEISAQESHRLDRIESDVSALKAKWDKFEGTIGASGKVGSWAAGILGTLLIAAIIAVVGLLLRGH